MSERSAIVLRTQTVHAGRVFTSTRDRIRLPDGRETTMDVVRHPPSVILLPMPDSAHIVLVRQYRYAVDRWIWELPAGNVEPGEDIETAARRECHEEIVVFVFSQVIALDGEVGDTSERGQVHLGEIGVVPDGEGAPQR